MVLAGVNVPNRESGKFLGVMIDRSLRFDEHVSVLCRKLSKTAGIFNRLKNILPTDILIKLYYSLVYPYFLYCNSVLVRHARCLSESFDVDTEKNYQKYQ